MIWTNIKAFLLLYFRPARAVSLLIDGGSWWLALALFVVVSFLFHFGVKEQIFHDYGVKSGFTNFSAQFGRQYLPEEYGEGEYVLGEEAEPPTLRVGSDAVLYAAVYFETSPRLVPQIPVLGRTGRWLFGLMPLSWLAGVLALGLLFVPTLIFVLSLTEPIGSFGLALRRDFGTLITSVMMAWSATHLPFTVATIVQEGTPLDPSWLLLFWVVSTLWFGLLMTVVLRVVFGCSYGRAAFAVLVSWPAVTLGSRVFGYLTPLLYSPFLLIFLWLIARGELGSIGASYRQRQSFRRYLESSTINPRDADAHFQLGLIYQQRRQEAEAESRFRKAIEIDPNEIDARFQLGKIERLRGNWQLAIDHFGVVVAENDKYAQGEIWREVGATYLGAGMLDEAREALEKYVERRAFDPEGLFYLGETLNKLGRTEEAAAMYERCLEAVQTMPNYRRSDVRRWSKLAREQLAAARA